MFFRALIAVSTLVFAAPAFAQLPQPLEDALRVEPQSLQPEAYVLRMSLGEDTVRIAITVDEENGSSHRLIEPSSEDDLTARQREIWAGFNNDDEAEDDEAEPADGETQTASVGIGDYDADAIRAAIGESATLLSSENGQLVYGFTPVNMPGQTGTPDNMLERLRGEAIVDAASGHLTGLRFTLTEGFKPSIAARIESFELEQSFVYEPALNGPRTAGVRMSMSGSSLFQSFEQTMRFEIEDIRYPAAD